MDSIFKTDVELFTFSINFVSVIVFVFQGIYPFP